MFFRKNIFFTVVIVAMIAGFNLPLRAEVDMQMALTGVASQNVNTENNEDETTDSAHSAAAEKAAIQNTISSISDIDRLFEESANFFNRSWEFLNKSRVKIFVLFVGLVVSYFYKERGGLRRLT